MSLGKFGDDGVGFVTIGCPVHVAAIGFHLRGELRQIAVEVCQRVKAHLPRPVSHLLHEREVVRGVDPVGRTCDGRLR